MYFIVQFIQKKKSLLYAIKKIRKDQFKRKIPGKKKKIKKKKKKKKKN